MKRSELIRKVAEKTGLPLKKAELYTNTVFLTIEEALAEREKVQIFGFGTFGVREYPGRNGRNPQTGKPIEIPSGAAPVFKAGKELKDAVNGK